MRVKRLSAVLLAALCLPAAGCSYLFSSEKRTVYQYEPSYGIESPDFRRSLDALGTELVAHNRAVLLRNGDETFEAILEAIRGARRSVNIEIYIFDHGPLAAEFPRALPERARP